MALYLKTNSKEQVHTNILMTDKYAHFNLKNMHIYLGKETKYLGEEYNGQKWSNYSKLMNKVQHNASIKVLVFENA